MSRVESVVVSSFFAFAVHALVAAPAFAQDPPAAEPPAAEPPAGSPAPTPAPPPPVAQQAASETGSVFDKPGFDFGARLGYGLPLGNVFADNKISDGIPGVIPLVLEAGYRINGNFTIGALFQYAVAQTKNCPAGAECSANVVRFGLEALYNFNLEGSFTPWVGLGTGYEWLGISESMSGQSITGGYHGFEFATLHAGGDFRVAPQFMLGPFVSFSLAQYSTVTAEFGGMSGSQDVPDSDKKIHEWLQFGIRGHFGI